MDTLIKLNREQGITVITITHYMNEAALADRMILMNKGTVAMDGSPRELFSKVEKMFEYGLTVPQITELMYELEKSGVDVKRGILHTMEAADHIEENHLNVSEDTAKKTNSHFSGSDPAIELENITVEYGKGTPFHRVAIDNLSIRLPKGKIIGLIGHTGSGKSTFARLLNGLLKPDAGKVYIDGVDIWEKPKEIGKIRAKVGLVFQYPEYQLFEETIYRDIAFGPKNMGITGDELDKCVKDAAKFCGIDESILESSPFEISGGQKRRVAMAGVIAMRPSMLVLDEPAAGLDPEGRDNVLGGLIDYHRKNGSTMLMISHSMEDIAKYADCILVMKDGKVKAFGDVQDIFKDQTMLFETGLDVPQITKLFVELQKRGIVKRSDIYTIKKAAELLTPLLPKRK
jgi:energy-coupling factor transport system ATP-binding protein